MPTDFKAFGIASVIKARGISRNKYKIKNNTKSNNELYWKPIILKMMYSKKAIKSNIISTIEIEIPTVLNLLI